MEHNKNILFYLIIIAIIVGGIFLYRHKTTESATFPFSSSQFDSYVRNAMNDWHVPGLALAVIKDDKVAYLKCYGVLKEGESTPVTEETIFAIGSCTKGFTATALGMLVDDGKVTWDGPVHNYLPYFQLPDAYMTNNVSVRDMLSHRTGLEEVGMLWDHTTLSRRQLMEKVRYLKSLFGFRSGWVYNNLIYLSAGEIIPAVTELSWDDFINQRIFIPLGMMHSSTNLRFLEGNTNVASPHYIKDDKAQPIAYHNIDCIAPAGAINSTIVDMIQWVRLHLNEGMHDGVRLLREDTINQLHAPQAIARQGYPFQLYGLGFGTFDYHAHQVVFHEGNIDGMSASLALLPSKKVGVMILTNMHRGTVGKVLLNYIFDKYLDVASPVDWNTNLLQKEAEKNAADKAEKEAKLAQRVIGTSPSLDLNDYIGTYYSDLYGNVVISLENSNLHCQFLSFKGELQHWQHDTFIFDPQRDYPLFAKEFDFIFEVQNRQVKSVKIQYPDPDHMESVFKKIK